MSVAEQRYRAVLAVISDGRTVTEVAAAVGVSRQTMHAWLPSMKPAAWNSWQIAPIGRAHPLQMPPEVVMLEARRVHPSWGPRRIAVVINKRLGVG